MNKKIILAAGVIIVFLAYFGYKSVNSSSTNLATGGNTDTTSAPHESINPGALNPEPTTTVATLPTSSYKDGTYEAIGHYNSPGGAETIDVTLTLKDGIVSGANVVSQAFRSESQEYQGKFISGYKQYVIGKDISTLKLDRVSGSSLTPKGFNDAVSQIKTEAQA